MLRNIENKVINQIPKSKIQGDLINQIDLFKELSKEVPSKPIQKNMAKKQKNLNFSANITKYNTFLLFLLLVWVPNVAFCSLTFNTTFNLYQKMYSTQVLQTHFITTKLPAVNTTTFILLVYYPIVAPFEDSTNYNYLPTYITSTNHKVRSFYTNTYIGPNSIQGIFLTIYLNQYLNISINGMTDTHTIYDTAINKTILQNNNNITIQKILDGYFTYTTNQIILLLQTNIGYIIKYIYINIQNVTLPYSINILGVTNKLIPTQIVSPSINKYGKKMLYNRNGNKIFILFSNCVIGYSADYLLMYQGHYSFIENYQIYYLDISIGNNHTDVLGISYRNNVKIFNVTTYAITGGWQLLFTQNYTFLIQNLKLNPPFVYINQAYYQLTPPVGECNCTYAIQIDITSKPNITYPKLGTYQLYDNSVLSKITSHGQTPKYLIQMMGQYLIFYRNYNRNNMINQYTLQIYLFNTDKYLFNSTNTTCINGYTHDITTYNCIKNNMTFPMANPILPAIYTPPAPVFPINVSLLNISNIIQQLTLIDIINQSKLINIFSKYLGKSLSFTSMRITPQFLFAFIFCLDDFYYYKYHNTKYIKQLYIFMNKIDIINQAKFMTKKYNYKEQEEQLDNVGRIQLLYGLFQKQGLFYILDIGSQQNKIYLNYIKNIKNYKNQTYLQTYNGPSQIYFLASSIEIYTNSLIFNTFCFIILKLLHYISFKFSRSYGWVCNFYYHIRKQTKWWTFIVAILQVNMVRLSFNCFLQLLIPSFYYFNNKINMIINIMVLFFILSYALNFYMLICQIQMNKAKNLQFYNWRTNFQGNNLKKENDSFHYYHKRNINRHDSASTILLTRSTSYQSHLRPYLYQSLCIITRNFMRSFINAFFINCYVVQIHLLFISDIFCICLSIFFKKQHKTYTIFQLTLSYQFFFAILDLFFLIKSLGVIQKSVLAEQIERLICITCLLCLSLFSFMTCAVVLFTSLFQSCGKLKTLWSNRQPRDRKLTIKMKHSNYSQLIDSNSGEYSKNIMNTKIYIKQIKNNNMKDVHFQKTKIKMSQIQNQQIKNSDYVMNILPKFSYYIKKFKESNKKSKTGAVINTKAEEVAIVSDVN